MRKVRGIVTWFNKAKGYGEILGEDTTTYFFTHQDIKSKSLFKVAHKDQVYEFSVSDVIYFGLPCATNMSVAVVKKSQGRSRSREASV